MNSHVSIVPGSHRQAVEAVNDSVWNELGGVTLAHGLEAFLSGLSFHTKKAYAAGFRIFFSKGLLNPSMSLQVFSLSNLENLLDAIKEHSGESEASKQARAASFVSFCSFLSRRTGGLVRRVATNREKGRSTFMKIRSKATTEALSKDDWDAFIDVLSKQNERDGLIAKMLLQGAKRISEVLGAQISQIDWDRGTITFRQAKTSQLKKETVIHYPQAFLSELKSYLHGREEGLIFTTRTGRALLSHHIWMVFADAGIQAGIGRVSPHMLRATGITWLREKGFAAEDIQKVSGHGTIDTVVYYDKSPLEQNPTKMVNLI